MLRHDNLNARERAVATRAARRAGWVAGSAALLVMLLAAANGAAAQRHLDVSKPALKTALASYALGSDDRGPLTLGSMRGNVLVVNFWASWCKPCRKELPALDRLDASIRGKGGRVLAVSIDHEMRNAERFAQRLGLSLPIFHDGPEGLASQLDLPAIPFTMVLDRRGDVVFTVAGAEPRALEELERVTHELIRTESRATRASEGAQP